MRRFKLWIICLMWSQVDSHGHQRLKRYKALSLQKRERQVIKHRLTLWIYANLLKNFTSRSEWRRAVCQSGIWPCVMEASTYKIFRWSCRRCRATTANSKWCRGTSRYTRTGIRHSSARGSWWYNRSSGREFWANSSYRPRNGDKGKISRR